MAEPPPVAPTPLHGDAVVPTEVWTARVNEADGVGPPLPPLG